jgi:phospholipid/cholesterol/gamma-HCH transport system permease protein
MLVAFFEKIGRGVYAMRDDFLAAMNILGSTIRGAQMKLGRGHGVNMVAIFNQIDRMGVGAIPVVVLMSAIVGAIVAQQGAFQLRYFGAEIFVVDLVGILVLRELGVLMTAIMVAGRSGSAITAEIGSMKMREEVDALKVIGLNPVGVLVFPRLVALVIALPCLTILANFAALGGAMAVAYLYSDIAYTTFIDRLRVGIDLGTIFSGLIKAPFMAMIIGILASVDPSSRISTPCACPRAISRSTSHAPAVSIRLMPERSSTTAFMPCARSMPRISSSISATVCVVHSPDRA